MPAINFKKQFVAKIKKGEKRQTIRLVRKHPIKNGDILYLYTGLRTKNCKKIKEILCKETRYITILEDDIIEGLNYHLILDKEKIAKKDGFKNFSEMRDFFKKQYGLPFHGVIIKW